MNTEEVVGIWWKDWEEYLIRRIFNDIYSTNRLIKFYPLDVVKKYLKGYRYTNYLSISFKQFCKK